MINEVLIGDVFEKIKEIPNETVDVVCTSPPYWGLRDYGVEGQIGLEPDFHDYLTKLNTLMRELKRVLKKTGTCWVNLGDTYSTVSGGMKGIAKGNTKQYGNVQYHEKGTGNVEIYGIDQTNMKKGLNPKCRVGIPERFYINCIDDGWIARNHIVWTKNNGMPSSVKDRFTNKWESIFFFSKNKKYYFDLDSVRVPTITKTKPFNVRVRDSDLNRFLEGATNNEKQNHNGKGEKLGNKQDNTLGADGKPKANYKGFNARWKEKQKHNRKGELKASKEWMKKWQKNEDSIHGTNTNHPKGKNPGDVFEGNSKNGELLDPNHKSMRDRVNEARRNGASHYNPLGNPLGKNPGDVFHINTRPFPKAHFAVYPVDLPLKVLKCACPKDGVVLDPFFGAGTTGLAAKQLGLNWIGIELNDEYAKIALERLGIA